jgi:hypothetical protein
MADSKTLTVVQAWAAVMHDVQAVAKRDRNDAQRFMFRGIDAVMNAVGPALRKHSVSVVPTDVDVSREHVTTSNGKSTLATYVAVEYTIYGPGGDRMAGCSVGEAMDWGDKGTAKAMSVAYRTFLLQALTLPTDEPDPDATTYERGSADPVQLARQQCRQITEEFCRERGLNVQEVAAAYGKAGGTADPTMLRAWLQTTYMHTTPATKAEDTSKPEGEQTSLDTTQEK